MNPNENQAPVDEPAEALVVDDATDQGQPTEVPEPSQVETAQNEGQDAPPSDEDSDLPEDDFDPAQQTADVLYPSTYNFEPAEDGSVDPNTIANQIEGKLLQKIAFQQQETRAWNSIDKKWGDQMTPRRRDLILNTRIANAVAGKDTKLTSIANDIMREFTSAKGEGRADANITRKVTKAASLETGSSNTGGAKNNDVLDRIASGDKTATESLLSQWMSEGKI